MEGKDFIPTFVLYKINNFGYAYNFELFGLRFFFFSEDHEPIHVHVVKGDDDAKISLEPTIDVVYNHGLKPKDLKRALQLAEMYKEDIIDVWNKYHS